MSHNESASIATPWLAMALAALALCFQPVSAKATTIYLNTGNSLSLMPSTSGDITFSFSNNVGQIQSDFLAWTLGIQVLPSGSVTGNVTLGTLTQSVSNPMPIGAFPDTIQPTLVTLAGGATINGVTTFYQIGMQTTVALGTLDSSTSYNMGTLGFTASGAASGTWNIYAVQQGGANYQSFWTDGSLTDSDFGNLPRGAGNSSILLGTISVGTTLVALYDFYMQEVNGTISICWETASEKNTVGFDLFRWDGIRWVKVNDALIPGSGEMGGSYRVEDTAANRADTFRYKLVEYETDGGVQEYGTYDISVRNPRMKNISISPDGVILRWLSREQDTYQVQKAREIGTGFEPLATGLPATPPVNVYTDRTENAVGAYYRILAE